MDLHLKNKIVVITGGTAGIGTGPAPSSLLRKELLLPFAPAPLKKSEVFWRRPKKALVCSCFCRRYHRPQAAEKLY